MNRRQFTLSSLLIVLFCVPACLAQAKPPRQQLNAALIAAVKKNDTQAVIAALKAGADANVRDFYHLPLPPSIAHSFLLNVPLYAKQDTSISLSALYLALGWRINYPQISVMPGGGVSMGNSVMQPAISFKERPENTEILQALLDAGAKPRETNPFGFLLEPAICFNRLDTLRLLLSRGADPNAHDKYGKTLLMQAIQYAMLYSPQINAISLLLDKGANVNARDAYGQTALMGVAGMDEVELVRLLLNHHADVGVKDHFGQTALSYAVTPEVISLLKQAGAKE